MRIQHIINETDGRHYLKITDRKKIITSPEFNFSAISAIEYKGRTFIATTSTYEPKFRDGQVYEINPIGTKGENAVIPKYGYQK